MDLKKQAYSVFDALKKGQSIIIDKFARNDPEAFRQYAKDYIDDGGGLIFNEDYSIVRKCESSEEVKQVLKSIEEKNDEFRDKEYRSNDKSKGIDC